MIEILRLAHRGDLITAEVFEELFTRELGHVCIVRPVPLMSWCRAILGPPRDGFALDRAARRFAAATRRSQFLCPNWQSIVLAPLLLALRNRGGARIRLLLIAHAPGAYAFEWALLRPLLRPGDLIVAPSESAKATIECLCQDLAPWVRVIPHPMTRLPASGGRGRRDHRVVSLGRIVPGKLLHRQVEAMAVLRSRRRPLPLMEIAGAVEESGRPGLGPYARTLIEKIHRLHLDDHVRLVGAIKGAAAKADFLSHAGLLLNLSVAVEESFGKAPVEAMGLGVPVLGTEWDGLPETVGRGGALVPVSFADGVAVDVGAERIADAIEALMAQPPTRNACEEQAARFAPAAVLPRYRVALEDGVDAAGGSDQRDTSLPAANEPAAATGGLLSTLPPLTRMSWPEVFHVYLDICQSVRASWDGAVPLGVSIGDRLRGLMLVSTRRPMERFLAGEAQTIATRAAGPRVESVPLEQNFTEFIERLAASVASPGLLSGRLACLGEILNAGRIDLVATGVEQLDREGVRCPGLTFLRAEAAMLAGDHQAAFDVCRMNLDLTVDSDMTANALRQIARIARKWRRPSMALPLLAQWLDEFPDSTESGPVWLDRSVNGLQSAHPDLDDARFAMERARALLGNHPVVEKASMLLAVRIASVA